MNHSLLVMQPKSMNCPNLPLCPHVHQTPEPPCSFHGQGFSSFTSWKWDQICVISAPLTSVDCCCWAESESDRHAQVSKQVSIAARSALHPTSALVLHKVQSYIVRCLQYFVLQQLASLFLCCFYESVDNKRSCDLKPSLKPLPVCTAKSWEALRYWIQ